MVEDLWLIAGQIGRDDLAQAYMFTESEIQKQVAPVWIEQLNKLALKTMIHQLKSHIATSRLSEVKHQRLRM